MSIDTVGVQAGPRASECSAISLQCGLPLYAQVAETRLRAFGFCRDSSALIRLVLDQPQGYALHALEISNRSNLQLIVVTWNTCAEYLEDLWELQPGGLVTGWHLDPALTYMVVEAIRCVCGGERYRLTPGLSTNLTNRERAVLRYVAQGRCNADIADILAIREHTVRNVLTSVYRKLGVEDRTQAALHYWNIWHLR